MTRPAITQEMRRVVAARDGLVRGATAPTNCAYCGTDLLWTWTDKRVRLLDAEGRSTPELDHVHSLFLGGPHEATNLVPSCLTCNRSKGAKRLVEHPLEQTLEVSLRTDSSVCQDTRTNPVPTPYARPDLTTNNQPTHPDPLTPSMKSEAPTTLDLEPALERAREATNNQEAGPDERRDRQGTTSRG